MNVFRVQKTSNYTVMSNFHLKEKEMSLKAKGLLSLMLSLPDNWDYSITGLVSLSKDNITSIKSTLKELKSFGYLEIKKLSPNQTQSGRFEYKYIIYEQLKTEKQDIKKQEIENLSIEKQLQLNTKIKEKESIKEKEKKSNELKSIKHKYGEYGWVQLIDKEYEDLKNLMGEAELKRCIEYIDSSAESTGNKNHWKGWKEVIRKCYKNNWEYNHTQKHIQSNIVTSAELFNQNAKCDF